MILVYLVKKKAMTKNPFHVWTGAWGALVSMTVLSALIGLVLPALLSREYTHWASTALFLWFGVKALVDARELFRDGKGTSHSDEFEEAQAELVILLILVCFLAYISLNRDLDYRLADILMKLKYFSGPHSRSIMINVGTKIFEIPT